MTKDAVGDYDATPGNNTDVGGHNIGEGCNPSTINNAIREIMAHLKTEQTAKDAAIAGIGNIISRTVVTTSGTHNFDADAVRADIEVLGGGGSGYGADGNSSSTAWAGAGGGAGGYARKLIPVNGSDPSSATITIGAGGVGSATGADGNDTTYSDGTNTLVGEGGIMGSWIGGTSIERWQLGGRGGEATGGDTNIEGNAGGPCNVIARGVNGTSYHAAQGGHGANSSLGAGGRGAQDYDSAASFANGSDARGYGSGGGGAVSLGNALAAAGGDGADGVIIITEYA